MTLRVLFSLGAWLVHPLPHLFRPGPPSRSPSCFRTRERKRSQTSSGGNDDRHIKTFGCQGRSFMCHAAVVEAQRPECIPRPYPSMLFDDCLLILMKDNFADVEDSPRTSRAPSTGSGVPPGPSDGFESFAPTRRPGSGSRSPSSEKQRRALAASTLGVGPVDGLGGNGASSRGTRRVSGARERSRTESR